MSESKKRITFYKESVFATFCNSFLFWFYISHRAAEIYPYWLAGCLFSCGSGVHFIRIYSSIAPPGTGLCNEISNLTFGLDLFVSNLISFFFFFPLLPRFLFQEPSDKVLGQLTGTAEELFIKFVVHR